MQGRCVAGVTQRGIKLCLRRKKHIDKMGWRLKISRVIYEDEAKLRLQLRCVAGTTQQGINEYLDL